MTGSRMTAVRPAPYRGRSEPPPSWLGPSAVPRAKNRANQAS